MVAISFLTWRRCLARAPLSFFRRPLCRLQRIDGSRTRESAALSRWLLRLGKHQVSASRPRHTAFNDKQVVVLVDAEHSQVTHCHARIAHVPRHAHTLEYARWKSRGTN